MFRGECSICVCVCVCARERVFSLLSSLCLFSLFVCVPPLSVSSNEPRVYFLFFHIFFLGLTPAALKSWRKQRSEDLFSGLKFIFSLKESEKSLVYFHSIGWAFHWAFVYTIYHNTIQHNLFGNIQKLFLRIQKTCLKTHPPIPAIDSSESHANKRKK